MADDSEFVQRLVVGGGVYASGFLRGENHGARVIPCYVEFTLLPFVFCSPLLIFREYNQRSECVLDKLAPKT